MGKLIGGVLTGLLVYGLSASGFGVFIFVVMLAVLFGEAIAANDTALTIYIVAAMFTSYVLPILASIVEKNLKWLIVIPIVTTVAFALPSSFVAHYGCGAGKDRAIYAMKAIPLVLGVFTVVHMNNSEERFDCRSMYGPPQ